MMMKPILTSLLSLLLLSGTAYAGAPGAGESEQAMRQALETAAWPADINRLASDYLAQYPQAPGAGRAQFLQQQAGATELILGHKDVRLYRRAFVVAAPIEAAVAGDIRQAALGDKDAALRMARAHQQGAHGMPKDVRLSVGWLQYAAALGNDQAAYDLAVYFRQQDQPAVASRYEGMALALNHVMPPALDHVRK